MRVRTHPSTRTPADARAPRSSRLGERLRQLRVAAGLTQSELAGDRFSKEYVSQIERGKTRPTQETIDWLPASGGPGPALPSRALSGGRRPGGEVAASPAAPPSP